MENLESEILKKIVNIESYLDNLKPSDIIAAGRDGVVIQLASGQVAKVFFKALPQHLLRSIFNILLISGKTSRFTKPAMQRQIDYKETINFEELIERYTKVRKTLKEVCGDELRLVDFEGLATYDQKVIGIIMPYISGRALSIMSKPNLGVSVQKVEDLSGVALDKYGKNAIEDAEGNIVLIDII